MAEPAPPLSNPRVASAIAYSAWWASGAVIWLVERDRPDVRFHGMQSLVAFGTVFLAWLTCWMGSFAALIVSADGFFVLQRVAQGILIGGFVVWAVCLVQVLRGARDSPAVLRRRGRAPRRPAHISPFQSSGSGLTDRKISRCHLPPPQGSMTSVAMTSTRISANVRASGSPSRWYALSSQPKLG